MGKCINFHLSVCIVPLNIVVTVHSSYTTSRPCGSQLPQRCDALFLSFLNPQKARFTGILADKATIFFYTDYY